MKTHSRSFTRLLTAVFLFLAASSMPCLGLDAVFNAVDDIPFLENGYTASGSLNITLGFAPPPGADLTVVKNTGRSFIGGTFSNVANGSDVNLTFGGFTYRYVAWYYGGQGNNDLVLLWKDLVPTGWGANASGQLGDKSSDIRRKPVWVDGLAPPAQTGVLAGKTIVQVAQGGTHSLALCADGTVVAWGGNVSGQLGDGSYTARNRPVRVSGGALAGKMVIQVAAGATHSLALCSDGTVASWGGNGKGQLGNDSLSNSAVPVAVSTLGVPASTPSALAGKKVCSVAAGNAHSMALTSEGKVVTWGSNELRQLGNNSEVAFSQVPVSTADVYYRRGMRVEADNFITELAQEIFRGVGAPILRGTLLPVARAAAQNVALPAIREAINAAMDSSLSPLIERALEQEANNANSQGQKLEAANNVLGPLIEEYIVKYAVDKGYLSAGANDGRVTSDADKIAKVLQTVNPDTLKNGIVTLLSDEALNQAVSIVERLVDLVAGGTITADEVELAERYIPISMITNEILNRIPGLDVSYPDIPYDTALKGKLVTAISAGADHNLALCSDGTLAVWGDNSSKQYGYKDSSVPLLQKILKSALGIAVAENNRYPKPVHRLEGSALLVKPWIPSPPGVNTPWFCAVTARWWPGVATTSANWAMAARKTRFIRSPSKPCLEAR